MKQVVPVLRFEPPQNTSNRFIVSFFCLIFDIILKSLALTYSSLGTHTNTHNQNDHLVISENYLSRHFLITNKSFVLKAVLLDFKKLTKLRKFAINNF